MSKNKTYNIVYHCSNCRKSCTKTITFGELAPTLVECEHCGCNTATHTEIKPWPLPPMPPRPKPYPPERDRYPTPIPWRKPGPYEPYRKPGPNDYPKYWCGKSTAIAIFQ